ncbi:MAG: helix-turn-helix domain-containing protein [Candidatus Parcubacteria bacterium]|nr:helix-turn-helix domain-containing protein [Candidatus Parcubacteria bacterium]
MKDETLGQVFKRYREAEGIKISRVENDLNISHRIIEAIENDNYQSLPDDLYLRNFIKAYAKYLSLDFNRLLVLYTAVRNNKTARSAPTLKVKVMITPQRLKIFFIVVVFLCLIGYLGFQINKIFQPPELIIYWPDKDMAISQNFIEIRGKTEKEARVFINEKEIFLDYNGEFKANLDLPKGINLIKISAGKKHSQEKVIYREILVQ